MEISCGIAEFGGFFGGFAHEVFGHPFCERGDEDSLLVGGAVTDFGLEVIELVFYGLDFELVHWYR